MSASPKRPITDDEREACNLLRGVSMPPASWDKRFNRDVLATALETGMIGEKSAPQLWRLLIRYRRQWESQRKSELLAMAEKLAAPDFRKLQAALRQQAEIDEQRKKY